MLLLTFCLWLLPLWESVIVLCLYVHSSIEIILMGKRELLALLNLSSWSLVMVGWLFLAMPWGCLRFVIVVFPDHTHLLFFLNIVQPLVCKTVTISFAEIFWQSLVTAWQSLVNVLHTCVSTLLNVLGPAFIWNLFQKGYPSTLMKHSVWLPEHCFSI